MTNKEAIKFAECLKNNWTINFDDLEPFCDMAIEALKSKSETTSTRPQSTNDCISRQAAIEAIGEKPFAGTGDEYDYEQGLQNQWERDVVAIKILPSAQPKKGRWVLHTYMPHVAYCTICERNSPYNRRWDFCPNCGADMRGEEDESN